MKTEAPKLETVMMTNKEAKVHLDYFTKYCTEQKLSMIQIYSLFVIAKESMEKQFGIELDHTETVRSGAVS